MFDKLDKKFKRAWLKALRSNEFYQVSNKLRNEQEGRCCLGVACDVALREGKSKGQWSGSYFVHTSYDDSRVTVPYGLAVDLHLSIEAADTLTRKNDAGVPFDRIANWISRNL